MQDNKIRSRLKAQLSKFTRQLSEGLSKPLERFVGEMLFGIQASQDVKLSNVARSLEEDIPLIKTEDRLSRNLNAKALERHLGPRLASLASQRVEVNAVLCLDLSDVRKEYAEKMEYLDQVWDGSEGEVHAGYWLCSVTAAEVQGSEITPLYQTLFSARAQDFVSENAEILAAVDQVPSAHRRSRHLGHRSGRGSEKAVGAAAGAARTLCHPLRGTAFGDQPTAPEGDGSPSGRLLPPPLSGAGDQDRQGSRESLRTSLWRRTVSSAGPGRGVAPGGGGRLRERAPLAPHQPFASAGLAIAMADRANLSDPMENWRVQSRTHCPVGARPTEAKRLRPRSWGGAVARKQDGGALRQHTQKGVCATHQVATYSERRRSLVTRNSGG